MSTRLNRALDALGSLREQSRAAAFRHHEKRERFDRIRETPAVVVVSDNLFPTPPHIAERMVGMLELFYGGSVLEPSCGTGRLLAAISPHVENLRLAVDVCDIEPRLVDHCLRSYPWANGMPCDFMEYPESNSFDRIIMNPPFRRGLDVKHIARAASLLAPGGLLVAMCYNGAAQNAKLRPIADTWEVLPENSFKVEGTSASVCLLTIRK